MVSAIASGTMDVGSDFFFSFRFSERKNPSNSQSFSAGRRRRRGSTGGDPAVAHGRHPTPSVAVAGGSGDAAGVVGFLGTNGTGP